jgi:hypothetical protein
MKELIEPKFDLKLDGLSYLGRGPEATGEKYGWSRNPKYHYRCVECGDSMNASNGEYWNCNCGAMNFDKDAGRFGSRHGYMNILIYERVK